MKIFNKILAVSVCVFCQQVFAVDLLEVYKQAVISDPTFQIEHAKWLSIRENIAIDKADLLPTLDFSAGYQRLRTESAYGDTAFDRGYYNNIGTYSLSLSQPIFNYGTWKKLRGAQASAKSAVAKYTASAQDLIYRTTSAYLDILRASDILRFTTAQKKSLASQLAQTREKFNVGLSTITELQQVQSQYDSTVASEIKAINDLQVSKEKLSEITGRLYPSYAMLGSVLPLVYPNPDNIELWVNMAGRQNYSLQASEYDLQAARENILLQEAGHLPTVNAKGSYEYDRNSNPLGDFLNPNPRSTNRALAGITIDFPILKGGGVVAKTRQAEYDYQKASSILEQTKRSVVSETRQAYLSIVSKIGEVKANKQAVISTRSSYESTLESYKVGVSTMIDVLQQESKLYEAEKNYANSQYDYIIQTLKLKQQASTLGINDVQAINVLLKREPGYYASSTKDGAKKPSKFQLRKIEYKAKVNKLAAKNISNTTIPVEMPSAPAPAVAKSVPVQVSRASNIKGLPKAYAYSLDDKGISTTKSISLVETTSEPIPVTIAKTSSSGEVPKTDPTHYTIQILAEHTRAPLDDLIKSSSFSEQAQIIPTKVKGQSWYILVLGDYANRKDAIDALAKLPKGNLNTPPWIRTYGSIYRVAK